MTIYTARIEEWPLFTDPKMLVLSPDVADVACKATDFIFDFSQPDCYQSGDLPAVNAPIATGGQVMGVNITSQGATLSPDGAYDIVWFPSTPGDGTLAAKAIIADGKLAAVEIVNPGGGIVAANTIVDWNATASFTSNPTVYFAHTQFRNLARNNQSTIKIPAQPSGRRGQRGLFPAKYDGSGGGAGALPVFDGAGLQFVKDVTTPLLLTGSIDTPITDAQRNPGEPEAEGFVDYLETIWCKFTAFAGNTGPSGSSDGRGGFQITGTSGNINERGVGALIIPNAPLNVLVMIGLLRRFSVGGDTQTLYPFLGLGSAVTALASVGGKAPSAYNSNGFGQVVGAMEGGVAATMTGTIYRVTREYSGIAGFTNDEVLDRLNAEWATLSGAYS